LSALKIVDESKLMAPANLERARRGAEAITNLRHPNIVEVYHIGRHEPWFFGVLEYMEGGSLADKLTGQPWSPSEAARLIRVLSEAVAFVHENGYVHRDLKPGNVLFKADGTPKLADFGLARHFGDASDLTLDGESLGTPRYMAPEQAMGKQDLGPAVDIYALGVILYELVTGRTPFQAPNKLATLYEVVHAPVPPIAEVLPEIPRALIGICMRCLEKQPRDRYESASALAKDLDRFLQAEPIPASRRSSTSPWRWLQSLTLSARLFLLAAVLEAIWIVVLLLR